jgi:serine phosphatase RsbU (regulator of sigma subunit)
MKPPVDPDARIAALERAVARQKIVARELEKIVEDRTRELYLAMERIKRQARLVGTRTAIALLAEHGTLQAAAPSVLAAFAGELGWQVANLWVVDPTADGLRCMARWRADGVVATGVAELTPRGAGLPGRVWATATTAWLDDLVDRGELRSACGFPIIVDGDVMGVIEMLSSEQRSLDEDFLHTLTALGSQIGQFIERMRTQEQLRAKELLIARRIQTALLPRDRPVEGLEISGAMLPTTEVAGDYFDIRPFAGGAWIGIGDVTGHGVGAGMVMVMVQAGLAALTRVATGPHQALVELNAVLTENVRERMRGDDHVTLTLMRYTADGRVVFAGAHEDILVWRAADRRCELIATPGVWLGIAPEVGGLLVENELRLARGDILIVYTDGITEARDHAKELFGIERLIATVEELAGHAPPLTASQIRDAVITRALHWGPQDDDISLVVARFDGA